MIAMWRRAVRFFASKATASTDNAKSKSAGHKMIPNSPIEASSPVEISVREQQLKQYQRHLAKTRKEYAAAAAKLPTKEQQEAARKAEKRGKVDAAWNKYVEGLKKTLNPPVQELQAKGLIPRANPERREAKRLKGQANLIEAHLPVIEARRKYLAVLANEVIPEAVTKDNLDAKIQYEIGRAHV